MNTKRVMRGICTLCLVGAASIFSAGASSTETKIVMDLKAKQISEQVKIMETAHDMAECARALGENENSVVIHTAKDYYNDAMNAHKTFSSEYETLSNMYNAEVKAEEEQRQKGSYIGKFLVSAYTPSPSENGGYAVTCTGVPLAGNEWALCAVDPNVIPLGSTIYIEGVGNVRCQDTGGAIKGNRIDLLVGYGEANRWGVQTRNVYLR